MAILWILLGAAAVVAGALFAAQNPRDVDLYFFGYVFVGVPLWLLIAVPAAVGLVLGALLTLPGRIRASMARRRLGTHLDARDKQIATLQQRVAGLERDLAAARPPAAAAPVDAPPEVPSDVTEVRQAEGTAPAQSARSAA